MITYPITIQRPHSRRSDSENKKIKNQQDNYVIDVIEKHINDELFKQKEPLKSYTFGSIAQECNVPIDVVEKYGTSIDCGSNGFTAVRRDLAGKMTYDELAEYNRDPNNR